jgi:arsenate reductase
MRYVLFVCTHNAGRSQMARAFFERDAPDDVRAESAGTDPREAVWPDVVQAMEEVGIDIAARKPRKLDLEMQLHTDWAVTMGCGDACPYIPGKRYLDWDLTDPKGLPVDAVRAIRDDIARRIEELVAELGRSPGPGGTQRTPPRPPASRWTDRLLRSTFEACALRVRWRLTRARPASVRGCRRIT